MPDSALYPLIWEIRRVFQRLRSVSDTMLEDLGITASKRAVLEVLAGAEALSVPQIAIQLSVTRQHIQVLVNSLLSRGLATSAENPAHKRSPLISLSVEGKDLFLVIEERECHLLKALQASFSNADLATALNTLETLEGLLELKEWDKKRGGHSEFS